MEDQLRGFATYLVTWWGLEVEYGTIHEIAPEYIGRDITVAEADAVHAMVERATITVGFEEEYRD